MNPMKDTGQTRERRSAEAWEPIRLAGTTLGEYRHVCAFFHSREKEYRVLLPSKVES